MRMSVKSLPDAQGARDSLFPKMPSETREIRSYEIYNPDITHHVILDFNQGGLKYRHVGNIAHFKGLFYATWNAHTIFAEGKPGQACYVAWSDDGKDWSDPVRVTPATFFPGGEYSEANIQWQGGLYNHADEELWFFWGEEPNAALNLSVLRERGGAWERRVIQGGYDIDGVEFMPFAHNNPIALPNGRIMLPIILQDFSSSQFQVGPARWAGIKKYSAALVSDDEGKTWHVEKGTIIRENPPPDPHGDPFVGVWEPMYVLQQDGLVRAFTRSAGNRLLTTTGDAEGTVMGSWKETSVRTLQSRHWVGHYGARRIMVHHDDYRKTVNWRDRRNLALFFSRTGKDDFVAGNTVAGRDEQVQYPHALAHGDTLYVAYTYEANHQLRCAIIDPLPDPNTYYVFPRGDRRGIMDEEMAHPETKISFITDGGHALMRLHGNASAGVDVDPVDPETDTLTVSFPLFIENKEWNSMIRFLSIGDGPVMLGWSSQKPETLQLFVEGAWRDAGRLKEETWSVISLSINKERVVVAGNGETRTFPSSSAFSGRVYLGDGYPDEKRYTQTRYWIDVSGLRTHVGKESRQ